MKQRQQSNKTNIIKTGSVNIPCLREQGNSNSSRNNLSPSPLLDEWNEYEKYKEEQEHKMLLLPPYNYRDDDKVDDCSEGAELSYSSRHGLFESYDDIIGEKPVSNDKPNPSYDFSPVENDICTGGFCIRDEITSCVSDISYNTGMQSGDYQSHHQPSHHMHYMEVVAQNSGFSGPSTHQTPNAIDTTEFEHQRNKELTSFVSLGIDVQLPLQQEHTQYMYPKETGRSASAACNTFPSSLGQYGNNNSSGHHKYDSSSSELRWMSSDDDLLKQKRENQHRQKEQLIISLIRRLQDNASIVHDIDNMLQGNILMRISIEKEGIITGYSPKNRSDILSNLNHILLKINSGDFDGDVIRYDNIEPDNSLHQAIQFVICLVKSSSVYGSKVKGDQWRPNSWFRRALQIEGEPIMTPIKPVVDASTLSDHSSVTPAISNLSSSGSCITTQLAPLTKNLPEGQLMCKILVSVSTIIQKLTIALEECTSSVHLNKALDKVKRNYLQLLCIPNTNINTLNDGFFLCSGLKANYFQPIESDDEGSQQIDVKLKLPSPTVEPNCINAIRTPWAMEYTDIQDSPLIFPTVINIPNKESAESSCNNLTTSVDTNEIDELCVGVS